MCRKVTYRVTKFFLFFCVLSLYTNSCGNVEAGASYRISVGLEGNIHVAAAGQYILYNQIDKQWVVKYKEDSSAATFICHGSDNYIYYRNISGDIIKFDRNGNIISKQVKSKIIEGYKVFIDDNGKYFFPYPHGDFDENNKLHIVIRGEYVTVGIDGEKKVQNIFANYTPLVRNGGGDF